jgi:uncharacterized Tic20 family protein
MSPQDLQSKIDAVAKLLTLFRMERVVYISVTLLALLILLISAACLLLGGQDKSTAVAVGMFGASGAITYTTSRLLRMWNQAFEAILGASKEDDGVPDK